MSMSRSKAWCAKVATIARSAWVFRRRYSVKLTYGTHQKNYTRNDPQGTGRCQPVHAPFVPRWDADELSARTPNCPVYRPKDQRGLR